MEDNATDDAAGPVKTAKSSIKARIRLAALAVAVCLIAWYIFKHNGDFSDVWNLSGWTIVAVLGIDVFFYFASAAALFFVLLPFSIRPRATEAFELAMMTRFFNIIVPLRGGAVARALYLKKHHDLGAAKFMVGLSGMLLTSIYTSLLWVLAGLVYLAAAGIEQYTLPIVIVSSALLALTILAMFRPKIKNTKGKIRKLLGQLAEGWEQFIRHKSSLLGLIGVYCTIIITQTIMFAILLNTLAPNSQISLGYLAVIVALGNISMAFQVTPGNMCVYEGLLTGISGMMGLDYKTILMVSLTWRMIDCMFVFVVGGLCSMRLSKRLSAEQ